MKKFLRLRVKGVGVIEMILLLVVLLALIMIFKNQLTSIVNNAFSKINSNANAIFG